MKQLKNISSQLASIAAFLRRYTLFIVFLGFSLVYGFLAYRINSLTQAEPDETAVTERLNTVGRTKVDQSAVIKMRQLEEQNIEVKTLFDNARTNPFTEQ